MLDTERLQIGSPRAWPVDHLESQGMETLYFKGDSFYASPYIFVILLDEYNDHHYLAAGSMFTMVDHLCFYQTSDIDSHMR